MNSNIKKLMLGNIFLCLLAAACASKGGAGNLAKNDVEATTPSAPAAQSTTPIAEPKGNKGFKSASGKMISSQAVTEFNKANKIASHSQPLPKEDLSRIQMMLENTVAENPAFVEAYVNLGVAYELMGNPIQAEASYANALKQASTFLPACTRLARLQAKNNNPAKALQTLSPCMEKVKPSEKNESADVAEALILQSRLKWQLGKEEETMRDLRQASTLYPQAAEGYVMRADINLEQKDFVQAKALYERALNDKKLKQPARVYNSLAICEWNLKNYATAVAAWEKAIQTDPSLTEPYFHLGEMALQSGDYARAEEMYRKIRSINSNDIPAGILLGVSLRGKGDFLGAEKAYLSVLQNNKDQPEALFGMAILYHKFLGRADAAIGYYERFSSVRPELAKTKKVQDLMSQARSDAALKTAKNGKEVEKKR